MISIVTSGVTMATLSFLFLFPLNSKNRHLSGCSARLLPAESSGSPRGNSGKAQSPGPGCLPSLSPMVCFVGIYTCLTNSLPCSFLFLYGWKRSPAFAPCPQSPAKHSQPKAETPLFQAGRMLSSKESHTPLGDAPCPSLRPAKRNNPGDVFQRCWV